MIVTFPDYVSYSERRNTQSDISKSVRSYETRCKPPSPFHSIGIPTYLSQAGLAAFGCFSFTVPAKRNNCAINDGCPNCRVQYHYLGGGPLRTAASVHLQLQMAIFGFPERPREPGIARLRLMLEIARGVIGLFNRRHFLQRLLLSLRQSSAL